ncbi:MAG TPA: hypothetical protein VGX92_12970 [Pyrinomonadaceae bacterium]|nr:hypothetical protein [Pyrinomonadaceae bacterium]
MSTMPKASKPKPKAPKKKAAPRKRASTSRAPQTTTTAPPERDDAPEGRDMPGMNMPPAASPSPAATPSDAQPETEETAAPSNHDTHTETASPPHPTPAPSPAASSSPESNTETPAGASPQSTGGEAPPPAAAPHGHDGHDMGNTGAAGGEAPPAQPPGTMPGMDMSGGKSSGMGRMDTDLMEMTGEQMNIRLRPNVNSRNTIAMGQMGSGTSWQPATTPMFMWYKKAGRWLLFLHGDMKLGVNAQGGPRGVAKFESSNWIMPMAFTRVGPGTLQLRGMFSFEPFTFPQGGSGLLFQTGETYKGRPIIDAQHPHDLFMELSATYTVPLGERATWFTYVGFPGEPALGPTAFMHRWSASENPSAPLSHHLQDSTHISFGVFTTGFTYRWFKLEGSLFNGREPDENRYNLEFNPWNSRSVRLSFAPNDNWAMQASYGLLKNPEALSPGDIRRATASVSYNKRFSRGNWASSLIWGRNQEAHGGAVFKLNSYVAESTLNFFDRNYLYTRLELVDKSNLLRDEDLHRLGLTHAQHPQFRIGAYTFGAARDLWNTERLSVALGGDFTFYSKPARLDPIYGDNPTSYRLFIRLRPGRMSMSGHGHTGH